MQFLENIPIRECLSVCEAEKLTSSSFVRSGVEKISKPKTVNSYITPEECVAVLL